MDRLRNRVKSPIRKQFLLTYKLSLNHVLTDFTIPVLYEKLASLGSKLGFPQSRSKGQLNFTVQQF